MRAFASISAISLALLVSAPAAAVPPRVASLNLCADELLLMLAEPGQVASVTHLSHDPADSPLWRRARHYRANDGTLMSVLPHRPDHILTMGGGGGRDREAIASRLGMNVVELPFPNSLQDIAESIGRTARALGRPDAGRRMLGRLQALIRSRPPVRTDAIWLGPSGHTVPATGLAADWMRLAGLEQRALSGDRVTLETLIAAPPALVLASRYRASQFSSANRWLRHPVVRRAMTGRTIETDGRAWTCMGPLMIGEIERLRGQIAP